MHPTSRRPRQPDAVRATLIAAAAELLAEGSPVSIGSVADLAGVSKGAVQHHFTTRAELFRALYDELIAEAEAGAWSGPDDSAPAWTYARSTLQGSTEAQGASWRALLVATVAERELAQSWSQWVARNRASAGPESTEQLVARLAADGLWLSDILGTYQLSDDERQQLASLLRQLAEKAPS